MQGHFHRSLTGLQQLTLHLDRKDWDSQDSQDALGHLGHLGDRHGTRSRLYLSGSTLQALHDAVQAYMQGFREVPLDPHHRSVKLMELLVFDDDYDHNDDDDERKRVLPRSAVPPGVITRTLLSLASGTSRFSALVDLEQIVIKASNPGRAWSAFCDCLQVTDLRGSEPSCPDPVWNPFGNLRRLTLSHKDLERDELLEYATYAKGFHPDLAVLVENAAHLSALHFLAFPAGLTSVDVQRLHDCLPCLRELRMSWICEMEYVDTTAESTTAEDTTAEDTTAESTTSSCPRLLIVGGCSMPAADPAVAACVERDFMLCDRLNRQRASIQARDALSLLGNARFEDSMLLLDCADICGGALDALKNRLGDRCALNLRILPDPDEQRPLLTRVLKAFTDLPPGSLASVDALWLGCEQCSRYPPLPESRAELRDALAGLLHAAPNARRVCLQFESAAALRLFASSFPRESFIEEVCVLYEPQGYNEPQIDYTEYRDYTDFLTDIVSDMRESCGGRLRRFHIAPMVQGSIDARAAIATVQTRFPDLRVHY